MSLSHKKQLKKKDRLHRLINKGETNTHTQVTKIRLRDTKTQEVIIQLTLSFYPAFPFPSASVLLERVWLRRCRRAWPSSPTVLCHSWPPSALGSLEWEDERNREGNRQLGY